jgi:basic membrane lipoprotein Med (substrate-binding protein (PBP1-ABC) superfamily)
MNKKEIIEELAQAGYDLLFITRAEHYDKILRMAKAYNDAVIAGVIDGQPGYKERLLYIEAQKQKQVTP